MSKAKPTTGKTRVSIQGYEGSFHQVAAEEWFGRDVQVIPCATFREVVRVALSEAESEGGVMAIENSIAGSILPNYNLLQQSKLRVVGEIYLQIGQNLLVNPGVQLEDIREVHSHPMALLQCIDYLERQPGWKLVETEDTALSAASFAASQPACCRNREPEGGGALWAVHSGSRHSDDEEQLYPVPYPATGRKCDG